ncbi:MAG: sigma 54-interacting transcriptional regulator [Acidobacteriota bacterium]
MRLGLNRVGSLPSADLQLKAEGVSRKHAEILADHDHLQVVDLSSKNGTTVNRQLVARAELRAGDSVAFGPAQFRVEEVHVGDRELGIDLGGQTLVEPAKAASTSALGWSSTRPTLDQRPLLSRWLDLVADVARSFGGSLTRPLDVIRSGLSAASVAFVEADRTSNPSIRSYVGKLDHERIRLALNQPEDCGSQDLEGDPLSWCWSGDRPRMGLLVSGEFEGRYRSEPLLRTLVALLESFGRPSSSGSTGVSKELRFPPGYEVGSSYRTRVYHQELASVATSDLPILLLGETGVGKELAARTLHLSSERSRGPFVAINCAAIPNDLLEAELFGVGEGVATGVLRRPGRFQEAHGGTLFLDEVGDMPASLQIKLLRVLQESTVTPLGEAPREIDVRLISATNSDLESAMSRGDFRRDLFFRIAGFPIEIPPLRDRPEDIPSLFEAFLRRFSQDNGKLIWGATVRAGQALVEYAWPGNVRELEHTTLRLLTLCPQGGVIDYEMLPASIRQTVESPDGHAENEIYRSLRSTSSLDLTAIEKTAVALAMKRAEGNQVHAARLLGLSRDSLRRRLERYGLKPKTRADSESAVR